MVVYQSDHGPTISPQPASTGRRGMS